MYYFKNSKLVKNICLTCGLQMSNKYETHATYKDIEFFTCLNNCEEVHGTKSYRLGLFKDTDIITWINIPLFDANNYLLYYHEAKSLAFYTYNHHINISLKEMIELSINDITPQFIKYWENKVKLINLLD